MNNTTINRDIGLYYFLEHFQNQNYIIEHVSLAHKDIVTDSKVYYYGIIDNATNLILNDIKYTFYPSNQPHFFNQVENVRNRVDLLSMDLTRSSTATRDYHNGNRALVFNNDDNTKVKTQNIFKGETASIWLKCSEPSLNYKIRFSADDFIENIDFEISNEWKQFTHIAKQNCVWHLIDMKRSLLPIDTKISYYNPTISSVLINSDTLFQGLKISVL